MSQLAAAGRDNNQAQAQPCDQRLVLRAKGALQFRETKIKGCFSSLLQFAAKAAWGFSTEIRAHSRARACREQLCAMVEKHTKSRATGTARCGAICWSYCPFLSGRRRIAAAHVAQGVLLIVADVSPWLSPGLWVGHWPKPSAATRRIDTRTES